MVHSTLSPRPTRRDAMLGALAALLATPAYTATTRYDVSPGRSQIQFIFVLNGNAQTGTLPVSQADVRIDPGNLAAARADVRADVRRAKTGLIFATDALKSDKVLDAGRFPLVRFRSTSIQLGAAGRISEGAKITGQLTLRGVTKSLTLNATLSRPAGSPADDLSVLNIALRGALSRRTFGAVGYPELVDDTVTLDIKAQLQARG